MGMTIAAFLLTFSILLIIMLDSSGPAEQQPHVPKSFRPPKDMCIKSMLKTIRCCAEPLFDTITEIKVRRRTRTQCHRSAGPRRRRHKKVPRDRLYHDPTPVMTTTWVNGPSDTPSGRQFDSDSRSLMLDDGASARITNDKGVFIEPPIKVNRKVRRIKGHAKATYRGTIKWHVEDDTGLVHVMIIRGAYLIPEVATRFS